MDDHNHPGDELQLLLDGQLTSDRRQAVEAHVAHCERCRRELGVLRRVKAAVREDLPVRPVPPGVAARVSAALAEETAAPGTRRRPAARFRRMAVIGLSLAAGVALLLVLARRAGPDFVAVAVQDFTAYRSADLRLQLETADPPALERFFAEGGLPFETRVFDFGMMGYRLVGGGVHRLAGRPSALFAYEGAHGGRLLCQMYQGQTSELPPNAEERYHDGIRFRIYRAAGLTLVFWQEGPVVCVLVADGDAEEAIQLAYGKAMKVS